jgi:hypothetical protein
MNERQVRAEIEKRIEKAEHEYYCSDEPEVKGFIEAVETKQAENDSLKIRLIAAMMEHAKNSVEQALLDAKESHIEGDDLYYLRAMTRQTFTMLWKMIEHLHMEHDVLYADVVPDPQPRSKEQRAIEVRESGKVI